MCVEELLGGSPLSTLQRVRFSAVTSKYGGRETYRAAFRRLREGSYVWAYE